MLASLDSRGVNLLQSHSLIPILDCPIPPTIIFLIKTILNFMKSKGTLF